ncbi:hypothetical protein Syun_016364 [Stephania yunnanensis]|uniref:Uncharacterized protein n=1 Tax=Stephania yunnanensis TaxID=152371 RepID=A0AAP0P1B2_9MAGN
MRPSGLLSPSAEDWSLGSPKPQLDNNHFDGTIPTTYSNMSKLLKLEAKVFGPSNAVDFVQQHLKANLQRRRQELTQTTPDQLVDDEAVYYKVAGDCPKGCVYNLRSLWRKKRRYVDPDARTSQHPQGVVGGGAGDEADPMVVFSGLDVMEIPIGLTLVGGAASSDRLSRRVAKGSTPRVVQRVGERLVENR